MTLIELIKTNTSEMDIADAYRGFTKSQLETIIDVEIVKFFEDFQEKQISKEEFSSFKEKLEKIEDKKIYDAIVFIFHKKSVDIYEKRYEAIIEKFANQVEQDLQICQIKSVIKPDDYCSGRLN